jgi:predicted transcriptional regulator
LQNSLKTRGEYAWIIIQDQNYTATILRAFGDDDKKKILLTLASNPKTINEVLTKCNIPKTSGYRKINALINDGIIDACGFGHTEGYRKVPIYISIFSDLKIDFIKNKVTVKIRPNKRLEKSLSKTTFT